jgi:rare lipoprotein A
MDRRRATIGLVAAIAFAASACEAEPGLDRDVQGTPVAMEQPVPQPGISPLPQEVIDRLKSEYSVLSSEPAPEPQPNGESDPSQIPERVRGAVPDQVLQSARGGATFYANKFEGRRTASGIPFRQNQMVAAHRSYPFGTLLRVTNLDNQRSVNVKVVDRGPFGTATNQQRTMIDLSTRAAGQLGFIDAGRAQVRVEVLEWGQGVGQVT